MTRFVRLAVEIFRQSLNIQKLCDLLWPDFLIVLQKFGGIRRIIIRKYISLALRPPKIISSHQKASILLTKHDYWYNSLTCGSLEGKH